MAKWISFVYMYYRCMMYLYTYTYVHMYVCIYIHNHIYIYVTYIFDHICTHMQNVYIYICIIYTYICCVLFCGSNVTHFHCCSPPNKHVVHGTGRWISPVQNLELWVGLLKSMDKYHGEKSHLLNVWYIYLHDWVFFGANVGKYSSTMEHGE